VKRKAVQGFARASFQEVSLFILALFFRRSSLMLFLVCPLASPASDRSSQSRRRAGIDTGRSHARQRAKLAPPTTAAAPTVRRKRRSDNTDLQYAVLELFLFGSFLAQSYLHQIDSDVVVKSTAQNTSSSISVIHLFSDSTY